MSHEQAVRPIIRKATFGYVRRMQKLFSMDIPEDIVWIIILYYNICLDTKILTDKEQYGLIDILNKKVSSNLQFEFE